MKPTEYIPYLDVLRFIAILFIIAQHTSAMYLSTLGLCQGDAGYYVYSFFENTPSVYLFILISGSLLLAPEREISYPVIFKKYCWRIIQVLLIFGLPMCFLEQYTVPNLTLGQKIGNSIINLITGNCWTHMWYLYMLLGLYILTPLFKVFINHSSQKDLLYLIGGLFVMSFGLYTLSYWFPGKFLSYVKYPIYLCLYPMGYYLHKYGQFTRSQLWIPIVGVLCSVAFLLIKGRIGWYVPNKCDIMDVAWVISVFVLVKMLPIKNSCWKTIGKCCFGIYLIHPVFLNVLFKVVHIEQYDWSLPCVKLFCIEVAIFLLCFGIVKLLRKCTCFAKIM